MKILMICSALSLILFSQQSFAQDITSTDKLAPAANAAAKAAAAKSDIDEDDMVPDVLQSKTFEYHCELKDFLTIYTNTDDNDHMAMRWKNHLYRLRRIATTTGANRFENKKAGLVWIGIPTKGMLLDSLHGTQLANECKTTS